MSSSLMQVARCAKSGTGFTRWNREIRLRDAAPRSCVPTQLSKPAGSRLKRHLIRSLLQGLERKHSIAGRD